MKKSKKVKKKKDKTVLVTSIFGGAQPYDLFDDCPVCQEMKKQGMTMQWFDDDDNSGVLDPGLGISEIPEEELETIKQAIEKTKN